MGETKRREEMETRGSGDLDEVWRVLTATIKSFESHRHDYPAIEAAIKSFKEHRHEGVEDAAWRLEILETWRAAYTLRTADKLEELEENTFQTDQAMRLCRLLRRDLTGVMERLSKLEKAPVSSEKLEKEPTPNKIDIGEWARTNRAAIEAMQGRIFKCATCNRLVDVHHDGHSMLVKRCVCAEGA